MTETVLGPTIRTCLAALAAEAPAPPVTETLHHYIVVRRDLPRGVQAAQIAHAAGESSPGSLPSGTHVVVLAAPGQEALAALAARLEVAGVPHVVIEEPDPPYGDGVRGQLMAIGCAPARKEVIRRHLSCLPLLR